MLMKFLGWLWKLQDQKKSLIGALGLAAPILIAKFPEYAAQIQPLADFVMQNLQVWTSTGSLILSVGLVCKFLKLILAFVLKKYPENKTLLMIEKLLAPNAAELRLV